MNITIRFGVTNAGEYVCTYDTAASVLLDDGLKALFKYGLINSCVIEHQGKRLTDLPFMTWERFEKALEPYTDIKGETHAS